MCGIIGVLACGERSDELERVRQEAMRLFTTELLQLTLPRGKDATGVCSLFNNGHYMGLKMGVSPLEFIHRFGGTREDYEGYMKIWRAKNEPSTITLGHCRKPSTGTTASVDDNNNNHPVKAGNIVIVHNGTLSNHEEIFKNLGCKRDGKVDSEAIARLLNHATNNGAVPFSKDIIKETCKRLSGSYAVLAMNTNNPYQVAAFRDARPIELALIKPLGLALIASEKDYLKSVCLEYNKIVGIYKHMDGMSALKKSDVEIISLADDSLYLFDLTIEITEETKIESIYTTEKVSRTEKVWVPGKAATSNYGVNTNPQKPTTNTGTTTSATSTDATSSANGESASNTGTKALAITDQSRVGRLWDSVTNTYVPEINQTIAKNIKNAVINCETSEFEEVGDKERNVQRDVSDPKFTLVKSDINLDTLVSSESKIVVKDNPPVGGTSKAQDDNKTTVQDNKVVSIDMHITKDAIDAANSAVKELDHYMSDDELSDAVGIKKLDMEAMPLFSMANRMMKLFFRRGFETGYMKGKKSVRVEDNVDNYSNIILSKYRKKATTSAGIIRTMKGMMFLLTGMCKDDIAPASIAMGVRNAKENGFDINKDDLSKLVRPGDVKKNPDLAGIVAAVKEVL